MQQPGPSGRGRWSMLCIGAGNGAGIQCGAPAPGQHDHLPLCHGLQLRRRSSGHAAAPPGASILPPPLRGQQPARWHTPQVWRCVRHRAPATQQLPGRGSQPVALLRRGYHEWPELLGARPCVLRSNGFQPGAGRHHARVYRPCCSNVYHCHSSYCGRGSTGLLAATSQTSTTTSGRCVSGCQPRRSGWRTHGCRCWLACQFVAAHAARVCTRPFDTQCKCAWWEARLASRAGWRLKSAAPGGR